MVVKIDDQKNLLVVKGSVPGSKNGIVLLRDAIKYKTPEDAPFPAGLSIKDEVNNEDTSSQNNGEKKDILPELEGAEVEN